MRLDALPVLGSGMEGTVHDLGDGRVAKVWHRRSRERVRASRAFGDALAEAGLPFAVPRVLDVLDHEGRVVTVEPHLSGCPATADDTEALVAALAGLAAAAVLPGLAVLPVLEGECAFDPTDAFPAQLADLVRRRADRFAGSLSTRVPDLVDVVEATVAGLQRLPAAEPTLVHGDLIPANVLLDDDGGVSAVLDFGFLTTLGDPAFDAAVTASIADMYSPRARDVERRLDEAIGERWGHDPSRLALYRAAYALVTSNCFSVSGSDGHFDWCVQMLSRDDVRAAL